MAYFRPGNLLFLYPDNGDGSQAANIVLAGNNTIANGQCTVYANGSSAAVSGNTLTLTLRMQFNTAFAGFRGIWTAAQTLTAQTSPWSILGAWRVPVP